MRGPDSATALTVPHGEQMATIGGSRIIDRDVTAGGLAGLLAGVAFAWAMQAQGMTVAVTGIAGLPSTGGGLAGHLLLAALLGAGFGALFRHQPDAYAATVSFGLVYGLLWWVAGPLTLNPLLSGDSPTWSLAEATAAFPSLVGHLVYGGLVGLGSYALVALSLRVRPEPVVLVAPRPVRRVVILGGGFGGVATAQRLEGRFARDPSVDVTLVSPSNYLLFTPMLAEVAASGLEAQHISAPVRAACPRTRFRRAEVEGVDLDARLVHLRTDAAGPVETLAYDHLVLAVGSIPNFYGLPGLEEHCFTLKTLQDATALRNHMIRTLERADAERDPAERRRLLTFAVVGAGFAGTEMVAELFDLARDVMRYYPTIEPGEARFVLIHSGERILPELSAELGAYALDKLRARGIEFMLGRRVAGATAGSLLLGDGSVVEARTLVWTAGNQPNPLLRSLPCERNRAGQVVTGAGLQVQGFDSVWAVGDCAQIPDLHNEGKPCPPTAQHALRQGKVAADNIAAVLRGAPPTPFRFRTIGLLVALGHRTAAAEVRGVKFSGLVAWLMWRSVYLSKLPGLEKKVRVALDWTIDLFFPRDIVLTADDAAPMLAETFGGDASRTRRTGAEERAG